MSFALRNDDCAVLFFVYDTVFLINAPAPPARQVSPQRFGFADTEKRIALYIPNQHIDSFISACSVSFAVPLSISAVTRARCSMFDAE